MESEFEVPEDHQGAGVPTPGEFAQFLVDERGRITACNATAVRWWQALSPETLCGRSFAELFAVEAPPSAIRPKAEVWARLKTDGLERAANLTASGHEATFETKVRITALTAADGRENFAVRVNRLPEADSGSAAVPSADRDPLGAHPALAKSHLGFFSLDFSSGEARCSEACASLLECERADLPTTPEMFAERLHPDDSDAVPRMGARGRPESVVPFSAEVRVRSEEHGWRWLQLEGAQTFTDTGRLEKLDAIMLDAHDRREIEEEMSLNEERFRRLTSHGSAGYFEIDLSSGRAVFSPEFCHALGLRTDGIAATPDGFMGLLPREDAEGGIDAFFSRVLSEAHGLASHYRLRHKDGRWVALEAFIVLDRDRAGRMEKVSALQTVAAKAEESSDQANSAGEAEAGWIARQELDAVAEAVVVIDPAGRILHVNTRAAQDAGQAVEDLWGESFVENFPLMERATGVPALEIVERALGRGQPLELDHSYALASEGGPVDVVITCRPLRDARQRIVGAVTVLRKPAEMPLSPAELLTSNRMEALGRLACGVAHDFNNLLTTVSGGMAIAVEKGDWTPLETAQKACDAAKNLARQLLTFARGDTTGKKVHALNDIIRDTAKMAGAGTATSVELELAADLHPVNIDSARFVQVFTNLILNAMQAMGGGGRIWLRTSNMRLGQINSVVLPPGDYVRIDIQDNGPGIPPENLRRIFQPFFTTRADGTGLGLSMVRSIVAQHDGAIEASSTVGSGTTFTIYLPRAYKEVVKEPPRRPVVSSGTGRVLVMDDDADLCMISKGMLELLGYEADTAQDGGEAIAKFRKQIDMGRPYAAVILDLTMTGGMGGTEVLKKLIEIRPDIKAIVSSGYATDENAEHYRQMGFSGILSKPYRSTDMGRVLKEVLNTTA